MSERDDLLASIGFARYFLTQTTDGLTDEQARRRTTVSELTLGGLIKHVALTETGWVDFVLEGPASMEAKFSPDSQPEPGEAHEQEQSFRLSEDETLAGVLEMYREVAARTDAIIRDHDLDAAQPLPAAPWFTPGETRSTRRVIHQLIAEIAQHAGHADILREALDGKKSMG